MLRRRHGRKLGALDFTSLVDIAMVLVVFFLLASKSVSQRNIPVVLPQAGNGTTPIADGLDLTIDRTGTVSMDGRPVELKGLPALAAKARRVTISADTEARHGRVVEVVDLLRRAGVEEIYYATQPLVEDW
jgi:biopolymer transport protein ExbD